MTGELFNLLKEHSILADLLQGPVEPNDAFKRRRRATRLEQKRFRPTCSPSAPRVLLGEAKQGGRGLLYQRAPDRRRTCGSA